MDVWEGMKYTIAYQLDDAVHVREGLEPFTAHELDGAVVGVCDGMVPVPRPYQ